MTIDELWPGGPRFTQDDNTFRLGTDSVLLSHFVDAKGASYACDLGCGSGIISILMAWESPKLHVDGIEIQPHAANLARENAATNSLSDRINIIEGDIVRHREFLVAGAYDLVVANPPYFAPGRGRSSQSGSTAVAREELSCTLEDICAAAAYLTRWGGKFALVHRPERLAEVIRALSAAGLEPKRLRFVHYRAASAPNLVLIESRRGGNPSLTVEPPLILTNEDGSDTNEVRRIYRRS